MVQSLSGTLTTVIVAHRLSTVKNCDQIAFLRDGRVVAAGTFDEVPGRQPGVRTPGPAGQPHHHLTRVTGSS